MTGDPTAAQIEAAARALRHAWFPGLMDQPATEEWLRRARAVLTAAAQVQPEPCCAHPKCPGGSICCCQPPAPEADEREAWLAVLIETAQDALDNDGGYLAADERTQILYALAAARRSQPAPRTGATHARVIAAIELTLQDVRAKYGDTIADYLDASWSAHLRQAGTPQP